LWLADAVDGFALASSSPPSFLARPTFPSSLHHPSSFYHEKFGSTVCLGCGCIVTQAVRNLK